MSERFKYSLNGVYRCENFAQNLVQNTFPIVQLGSVGGTNGWYIKLVQIENGTVVYPFIHSYDKPRLKIHSFFNILGKDGQPIFEVFGDISLKEIHGPYGSNMNVLDILNETNGYLNNGTFSIEYGIQIDGILRDDGIFKFNLYDRLFNPDHSLTIEYGYSEDGSPKVLYGHKQLLRFHSPLFQNQVTKFISRWTETQMIEVCLQVAHGVRIPLDKRFVEITRTAHDNKLRNVVQYLDQQLVEVYWRMKIKPSDDNLFANCIEFGLRHFLAHLINTLECLEDLKYMIQKLDIEKMSGEATKTFVAKIFKLGTQTYRFSLE